MGEEQILGLCKEKISKSLIAQNFADLLSKDSVINKEILDSDNNIKYLIKAIKYTEGKAISD